MPLYNILVCNVAMSFRLAAFTGGDTPLADRAGLLVDVKGLYVSFLRTDHNVREILHIARPEHSGRV